MLTGESMPVEKTPGPSLIGGTLNRSGMLRFRATRVGKDTALSQIIKLVEEAQASTAQVQRLADQVTQYFVPAVVGVAVLAFVGWWIAGNFPQALLAFIAVLIISCPCALGVATPAALMVGVGKGAEAGILIRGAEVLERARKLNVVVFDKTGTLTRGEPNVTDIVPLGGQSEAEVLRLAAARRGRLGAPARRGDRARGEASGDSICPRWRTSRRFPVMAFADASTVMACCSATGTSSTAKESTSARPTSR